MTVTALIPGQRMELRALCASAPVQITIELSLPCPFDVVCFGVDANRRLSDDRYFVFYNQLSTPEGAVCRAAGTPQFTVDSDLLPTSVETLVFAAAIDGNAVMSELRQGRFSLSSSDGEAVCDLTPGWFHTEKAVILFELYRKNGIWRVNVVCKGFDGGLSALLAHFGGEEESPPPPPKVSLSKAERVHQAVQEKAPYLIDLTKKAAVSLEKKKLSQITAQVVLVLDVSGSMYHQYRDGKVQRLLDKVLPLALLFDDDGALDVWAFGTQFRQLEAATLGNISDYVNTASSGWKRWDVGGSNNEPPVMEAIFRTYEKSKLPVYILFISDGGVSQSGKIKKVITAAAYGPLFWQFVGIGGRNYGVLEKLDEMQGRFVDNANFFAMDDIDQLSDEALFDRLMGEFPQWLKLAEDKHIL